jgi:HK97 family phage prohead protease
MVKMKPDFCGWVTKFGVKCTDRRVITPNAFKHCDGKTVPLVWNHNHDTVENIAGKIVLEQRDEGLYGYAYFNDTPTGRKSKACVEHGDITGLSLMANHIKEIPNRSNGTDVVHGDVQEVSLVIAQANPGAGITSVCLQHSDTDNEMIFELGEADLLHGDDLEDTDTTQSDDDHDEDDNFEHSDGKTVGDVLNSLTEEQMTAVAALIGTNIKDSGDENDEDEEDDTSMKHNAFEGNGQTANDHVLTHSDFAEIIGTARKGRLTLKEATEDFLEHGDYGIDNIDFLFPDAQTLNNTPDFIKRDTGWVGDVMNGAHHSPFSRVKTVFANITADEARAKGYIKGKRKLDEVFTLLKRSTEPQTIYKKQKLDKDDVDDITSFEVVQFVRGEMRIMLDEEIARAVLVGDGRQSSAEDKIKEDHIRPIWKDDDLYAIKRTFEAGDNVSVMADNFIDEAIRARKEYKGSGNPVLFAEEEIITNCLLLKDKNGRRIYGSMAELATAMRVSKIVTVPIMEGLTRETTAGKTTDTYTLHGIIVNMNDYNIGADKGGKVSTFDDFDIDYNQYKYLIETRCSGALVKPYSAIVLETKTSATSASESGLG